MKRLVFICALILATGGSLSAQIENQAATYDLTMADSLAGAFNRNPEIQRARTDIERAAGTKLDYRSRAWPQLATQVRGGWRQGSLYDPDGFFSTITAQFRQPLIDVGIPPTFRRGQLEVVIAQQNLNREVTGRLHETRVTFLRALYLRDLISLYEEIGTRLQANVESEQQRLTVGAGSESAMLWAKIQKLNLARDLANLRADFFATVTRLAELCGRNLEEPADRTQVRLPKPDGQLQYAPVKFDLAEESVYAVGHRADLKLLQALADSYAADAQAIRAGYFPLVALTATTLFIPENTLLVKQTGVVPGRETVSSEVRAGVSLTWRIIDNGQVTGAARRTDAGRQAYEIARRQLEENVPRELAVIQGALQSADARREALLKSADSAEENLKLIEARLSLGEATQLDFLKAQSNLLSVRVGIADATYAHEVARAELDRATGRYLQFSTTTNAQSKSDAR